MTAQWLVPAIVCWCVVELRPGRPATGSRRPDRRRLITSARGSALLVSAQVFIGEEVLFLAALTLLVIAVAYARGRPRPGRGGRCPASPAGWRSPPGSPLLLLAYPLWVQFAGPQARRRRAVQPGLLLRRPGAAWSAFSPLSLAGSDEAGPADHRPGRVQHVPRLAAAAGRRGLRDLAAARRRLVVACVVGGAGDGRAVARPARSCSTASGPRCPACTRCSAGLPVVDGALPMRFALALLPLIATLLVLARRPGAARHRPAPGRLVPAGGRRGAAAALPDPAADRRPAAGAGVHHRRRTGGSASPDGGVLVPVPLPTPKEPGPMRWAAAADAAFAHAGGLLHRPVRPRTARAAMGTYKRPTSALLAEVARTGDRAGRSTTSSAGQAARGPRLLGRLLRRAGRRRPARGQPARHPGAALGPGTRSPTPGPGGV